MAALVYRPLTGMVALTAGKLESAIIVAVIIGVIVAGPA
jgi:hypothetical protein